MFTAMPAVAADCYDAARIPSEKRAVSSHTVLLLDETTVFDATQRKHIVERLMPLLTDGSTLEVVSFSAFSQGRYSTPGIKLQLAAPLDEATRMDTRKNILKDFEVCLILAKRHGAKALRPVGGGESEQQDSDGRCRECIRRLSASYSASVTVKLS